MFDAERPLSVVETTARYEESAAACLCFLAGRAPKKRAEIFRFYWLRKSKDAGLLELFWGEQPPFALLRSVEGGTFLSRCSGGRPRRRDFRELKNSHDRQFRSARFSDKGKTKWPHEKRRVKQASALSSNRKKAIAVTFGETRRENSRNR